MKKKLKNKSTNKKGKKSMKQLVSTGQYLKIMKEGKNY